MAQNHTIYALSTARGVAGIAVIRVSGPQAFPILEQLTKATTPPARQATRAALIHPETGMQLDDALILIFKNPASFTGEDLVEYHIHGGLAVVTSVLEAISHSGLAQMAEPGEFTRRAFDNGKMDLTQAEALGDLIHAETELQRRQAILNYEGSLSELIRNWRQELTHILAYCDATLDFADEDLPDTLAETIKPRVTALQEKLREALKDQNKGERLRDGIHLAIIGAPNAGKSSLINRLTGRDIAITSDIAGTTRDVVEAHLNIGHYPFILADTAGLNTHTDDEIERLGIERTRDRASQADIQLLVFDATANWDDATLAYHSDQAIIIVNKCDLHSNPTIPDGLNPDTIVFLSAETGEGLTKLTEILSQRAESLAGSGETPTLTRERHRSILLACLADLDQALNEPADELVAENLRQALNQLGRITGHVDVEDLLDVIFSDFCIGK